MECVDWTGGQIGNNDSADDMKNSQSSFPTHYFLIYTASGVVKRALRAKHSQDTSHDSKLVPEEVC